MLLEDGNQPSPADISSIIDNTGHVDLAGTSSEEEDSSAVTTDAVNVLARPSDKNVVPKENHIESFGHTISSQTGWHCTTKGLTPENQEAAYVANIQ